VSFFLLLFCSIASAQNEDLHHKIKLLSNALDIISRSYVDEISVDELLEAAINGMLSRLDSHSVLLQGQNYQQWEHDLQEENDEKSIPLYTFLTPGIAYIKIDKFTGQTDVELNHILEQLLSAEMKKLILDLRGNPGGYFITGLNVVDLFLPGGLKIVSTKGRTSYANRNFLSTPKSNLPKFPMIVLVDGKTASTAELVAGALQYWHRAQILGQRSYGKGLIQSQYIVDDNSCLLLTTSRYYFPDGCSIPRNDSPIENRPAKFVDDFSVLCNKYTLLTETCSKKHKQHAENVGGIIPDILIPEPDHSDDDIEIFKIFESNFIKLYSNEYSGKHPEIEEDSLQFLSDFSIDEKMWMDFQKWVKSADGSYEDFPFDHYQEGLLLLLKSELADVYWGKQMREFVKLLNNRIIQCALAEFESR